METGSIGIVAGWLFGLAVLTVGILNIILVHPVPGIAYIFLSTLYFPPLNAVLHEKAGFSIPAVVKIVLAIIIFMFTLGVSDLADMYNI